jgi:glycosyltransferase involved in cell wall biosynthesis
VRPRRIAIDYTAAVRQGGGIGRYTRGLVHALAELPPRDEYVLLVAGQGQDPELTSPAFRLKNVPLDERYLNILWHRLGSPFPRIEWLTGPVDIFHSPNFVLPPVGKARTVLTIHDLSFLRVPQCAEPTLRDYLGRVVPRAVARADRLLADSHSTRHDVIELLGVDPGRVDVVPAGVEARFRPLADRAALESVRERYRLGREPFILSLGTLEPRKNFAGLMEGFARLRQREKVPHRLVIVGGKGWLYEGIFEAVRRLGLDEAVTFAGFVADEDLPAVYNLAEAFAFPTLYEGFGLPVLEAMACGTPVVTADNSCMPELVGDAALLIGATDTEGLAHAVGRLLFEPALREKLIAAGLERAKQFTWGAAAQKLLAAYDRLLAGREG